MFQVKEVTNFIFLGSKVIVDSDCSHKIKGCLLLGRKSMTNLDSVLKSRDITLPTKVCSQSYSFSSSHVWMWGLDHKEGWMLKNWCFWIVVLRRLLRVLWTARGSNQAILKEINPEYLLEGLMLKLQYLGHLMRTANSLEKTLSWEKWKTKEEGDGRRWDG